MKPGFALTLSFEGISLLHRAAGGWRMIGDVSLDNTDLAAALADLRDKAGRLAPGELCCKLIIPNEQIRYLTIETGSATDGARTEMVLAALDGATPYPLAKLAFDISVEGDMTHVAAVARETLAEAEAFAVEHLFNPVSFVAIPGDNLYLGEPHFGPTSHAAGFLGDDRVEADNVAVIVVGMADIPKFAPQRDPEPEPEPESEIPAVGFASRRRKAPAQDSAPPAQVLAKPVVEPDLQPVPKAPPTITPTIAALQTDGTQSPDATPSLSGAMRHLDAPATTRSNTTEVPVPSLKNESIAAPKVETPETKGGFLSRRKNKSATPAPTPTATQIAPPVHRVAPIELPTAVASLVDAPDETQRMTVFGARTEPKVGGKPRYLGLILTAMLLLFLAGVAAWASLFMDTKLSEWLFLDPAESELAEEPEPLEETPVIASLPPIEPNLTDTDAAVLDAMRETEQPTANTKAGIAPIEVVTYPEHDAPQELETPAIIGLDDLYIASIDRTDLSHDAVALPSLASLNTDFVPGSVASPVAVGTEFALDARGLVTPSVNGTVNPDGVIVYLGQPPARPPPTPARDDPEAEAEQVQTYLARLRPLSRPEDLVEQNERAKLGGLTRTELGRVRPLMRPELPKVADPSQTAGTKLAVAVSVKPLLRPADLELTSRTANLGSTANISQVATIAPRTVTPKIPSSASVARQATLDNAINLRKINLIGVYGTPADRRALVRLPSGRYKKVKVGDSIDGGRILAISDSELRYQKGGRSMTLKIPSS
ncbi:MAG: hypothetical protein KUG70_02135 [Rhodobacteraceae bacterium]|nr:hypothetical protein [Paracoccaceae bacterium]